MEETVQKGLHSIGDHSKIKQWKTVGGGDINRSFFVQTGNNEYFIKGNQDVPPHFFKAEAEGLGQIQETNTIAVPRVHYYDEPEAGEEAIMIMDWIPTGRENVSEQLGHQLARMHRNTKNAYGFHSPTFVGELDQPNTWSDSWLTYYRDFRLKGQLDYGHSIGTITGNRYHLLTKLLERLEEWIPHHPSASLLHGDLWGGNWMNGADGNPYLIDPSILYGDHAFELAFTELFGGFSPTFYKAYEDVFPLPAEYENQKPLYQLFYLLVHLNMFGESYGGSVDSILKRYVG